MAKETPLNKLLKKLDPCYHKCNDCNKQTLLVTMYIDDLFAIPTPYICELCYVRKDYPHVGQAKHHRQARP